MQYDITRDTFDPANQYSRVLMRQGSVMLDADWNEQHDILLDYMRTLARDLFGRHAGPSENPGFEIIASADPNWQAHLNDRIGADPLYQSLALQQLLPDTLIVGPGRYYVDGIMVTNDAPLICQLQLGSIGVQDSLLIYLDVWERLVTSAQNDAIREKALGGPETCGRTQVCWRVRALKKPTHMTDIDIGTFIDNLPQSGSGSLRARAQQISPATAPCVIAPDARYRGLENHLYRVEIHQGGEATGRADGATIKWSRDNGAAVFSIRSFGANMETVEVETLGRDRRFGLQQGDWVEVINDRIAVNGITGPLLQVVKTCGDSLTVTLKSGPDAGADLASIVKDGTALHPILRLWTPASAGQSAGAMPIKGYDDDHLTDGWTDLEEGIQVRLSSGGLYKPGDYWLIPARVATGDIEWPRDRPVSGTDYMPAARPPHGVLHHYAPLVIIQNDPTIGHVVATDRRCRIARLPCL